MTEGQDQAAGLRKWANQQRQQQGEPRGDTPEESADNTEQVQTEQAQTETSAEQQAEIATAPGVPESEAPAPALEPETPEPSSRQVPTASAASEPETVTPPKPKTVLMVVGLPSSGTQQAKRVKARLGQWSALGRQWAGDPNDWDVRVIMPDDPALHRLAHEHSRWALWVNSHANAFADTYRTLRQVRSAGGPKRLLALHEPHLSRAGLLDNLHAAARVYLGIELLILAQ